MAVACLLLRAHTRDGPLFVTFKSFSEGQGQLILTPEWETYSRC